MNVLLIDLNLSYNCIFLKRIDNSLAVKLGDRSLTALLIPFEGSCNKNN